MEERSITKRYYPDCGTEYKPPIKGNSLERGDNMAKSKKKKEE